MKMKIAYAGFDLMVSALETLGKNNEIIKLFTCKVDGEFETIDGVLTYADDRGIPYTLAPISRDDVEKLIQDGCELLVSAGYYHRIPIDDRLPMVNIHPSLLPYGRGPWSMPLAILDELPESGVTVHKTEESFDTGDILLQERFDLSPDETLDSFMEKVNALLPDMMRRLTADFAALWDSARPQGEGVYLPEPQPEDYMLTCVSTPEYADRVLRAFYGYYAVYTDGEQMFRIRRGRVTFQQNADKRYPVGGGTIKVLQEY